jgi:lysozyme family protein
MVPALWRIETVGPLQAFNRIMEYEGGGRTHTVAGDPGGTTKWGISQRAYPHVDVANLGKSEAFSIFEQDYWLRVRADVMPEPLQLPLADLAFNVGTGRAGKLLQRSINLCKQADGRDDFLEEDGMIGPATLGAIDETPPARLARVLFAYRMEYYLTLAETGMAKCVHGWLRRAEEIHAA